MVRAVGLNWNFNDLQKLTTMRDDKVYSYIVYKEWEKKIQNSFNQIIDYDDLDE